MYITYDEYTALYSPVEDKLFSRLAFEACRYIDRYTTGIDGVRKLSTAFPDDAYSAEAVKRCTAEIISFLVQIQEAEKSASMGRALEVAENGMHGKTIASVSAGNESITYASTWNKTAADVSAANRAEKERTILQMVLSGLSGVCDKNGVNLLYMGRYPV